MGRQATASPPGSRGGSFQESSLLPARVPAAVAAAASAPRTAPARPPPPRAPGTVPGAPHPGPAAAQRSARPEAAPRRLEGAARRVLVSPPPTTTASLSPPCSVLPSALQNQPTRHSGPSSREGRGGAGREVGEPGGDGGGVRGAQLEPAFLLPGAKPSTPALLPCLLPCTPETMHAAFGLLGAFWSS